MSSGPPEPNESEQSPSTAGWNDNQRLHAQRLQALGLMSCHIAHELKNLLTPVVTFAAHARDGIERTHPMHEALTELGKAADRAHELVRRIVSFGGRHEGGEEPIDLREVIADASEVLRAIIPRSAVIQKSFAPSLPRIMGNVTEIHQVVINLGLNAWQALKAGCGHIDLTLDWATVGPGRREGPANLPEGACVRLRVSDDGHGMDQATLAHIFEPFFTTKEAGQGTGLGLPVVQEIVHKHRGAISVESSPGVGTTFTVFWPALAEEPRPLVIPVQLKGRGERILCLDDDEDLVALTKRSLERLGFKMSGFTHPEEAIKVLRESSELFDLVVCDISMPGTDGHDFALQLAKIRPNLPVMLVTGCLRAADQQRASEAGLGEVFLKPPTIEGYARPIASSVPRVGKPFPDQA